MLLLLIVVYVGYIHRHVLVYDLLYVVTVQWKKELPEFLSLFSWLAAGPVV